MTDFFESRAGLALTILLLSALGGVGLAWFGGHVIQLVSGLIQKDEIIRFDKGAIYMLGGGIVITALLAAAIPKVFFQKDLSKTIVDVLVRCLLAGFATMITLPHLVHLGCFSNSEKSELCCLPRARFAMAYACDVCLRE